MIKTSKYFRDYVRQSGREDIDCYVMIGGTKVERRDIESLKVNYSLGDNNIPSIGNAVSQTLTMTLYRRNNVPNYLYLDRTVIPYIGFKVFNGRSWQYEYIKLGTFYVPNSDNVTKNDFKISMTCFDNMARMSDKNRKRVQINYNKPEVPTGTVRSICEWLSRKAGIQFDYSSIDEDIPVNVSPAGWNVREVLQELAFIQGKNVIVNRDNIFTFIRPKEVPFKEFNIKPKNIVKLNWSADLNSNIAALQVEQLNYTRYDDELDAPLHTYEVIEGGGVEYDPDDYDNLDVLQDNQITGVGFKTSIITSVDELVKVYDRCMPYSYYKFNMTTQGFPQVEIGDIITVTTLTGDERKLLIASHELVFDGGCKSTFITSGRDAEYLDVCDIQWWDLVTKTEATEEESRLDQIEEDIQELRDQDLDVDSGTTTITNSGTDFWAMYLKTMRRDDEGEVDGIYAPPLIHIEKIENGLRFKLGYLKYNSSTKDWDIDHVDTFEHVCNGGGGTPTNNYALIIHYVYDNGTQAFPDYVKTYSEGSTYSVTSPTLDGYNPDQTTVSGIINSNTEVTVTYKAVPKYTLTIHYVYSTGGTAAPDYVNTYNEGSQYSVPSPVLTGYRSDRATVSGTINNNTEVTVTYTAIPQYTLTINYVYSNGGTAAPTYSEKLYEGEDYYVSSPSVNGYEPDKSSVSGTITSNTIVTVTYVFEGMKNYTVITYNADLFDSVAIDFQKSNFFCSAPQSLFFKEEYNKFDYRHMGSNAVVSTLSKISVSASSGGITNVTTKDGYYTFNFDSFIGGYPYAYHIVRVIDCINDNPDYNDMGINETQDDNFNESTIRNECYTLYCRGLNSATGDGDSVWGYAIWSSSDPNQGHLGSYSIQPHLSNALINMSNTYRSGYVSLIQYKMSTDLSLHKCDVYSIPTRYCSLWTGKLAGKIEVKGAYNTVVSVNYNPTVPGLNKSLVIPSYAEIGFKDVYPSNNPIVASTAIMAATMYQGKPLVAFGRITGVSSDSDGKSYINYEVTKGFLFNAGKFDRELRNDLT